MVVGCGLFDGELEGAGGDADDVDAGGGYGLRLDDAVVEACARNGIYGHQRVCRRSADDDFAVDDIDRKIRVVDGDVIDACGDCAEVFPLVRRAIGVRASFRNEQRAGGDINVGENFRAECRRHCRQRFDLRECRTFVESITADRCQRFGEGDCGEILTSGESIVADSCQRIAERHFGDTLTVDERRHTDFGHRVREFDGCQASAVVERVGGNHRDLVAERYRG